MQAEKSEIEEKLNQLKLEVEKAESLLSRSLCFSILLFSYPFTIFFFFVGEAWIKYFTHLV